MALRTCPLGQVREHHAEIGSTNDRALAWAREGAPHGALVTADAQTAGRGRLGRVWDSRQGGLYASVVLRPDREALVRGRFGAIGLAVGLGLREGLARWVPHASLKWPNDLLCGGRKLAGVLCETRWFAGAVDLVAGFGVNVEQRGFSDGLAATRVASELSEGAGRAVGALAAGAGASWLSEGAGRAAGGGKGGELAPGTGESRLSEGAGRAAGGDGGLSEGAGRVAGGGRELSEGAGRVAGDLAAGAGASWLSEGACPSRQEVLTAVLEGLEGVLADFFAGGFAAIRGRYQAHSAVIGRAVRVGEEVLEAVGFDDDGALRVRGGGGTRRVEVGDVWLAGDGRG